MKTDKQALLSAMKKALPGVEKGTSIIEGADTFVLTKNAIHSYNDNISVSSPFKFDEEISGAVKSLDFFKLISKMPTDDIEIESREECLKVNSGTTEAELTKVETQVGEYIKTLNIDTLQWKQLPAEFFPAIKLCKIDCNNSPHRGIFVNQATMLSTDIARINWHQLETAMDRFWLDDPAVIELLKLENLSHYCVTESWVHFKSEDGTIFSCKKKDDSIYMEEQIKAWLDKCGKENIDGENVFPKGLLNVVDRVSTLAEELDGLPAIQMNIKKTYLEFFAQRSSGKIKEKLELEKPFEKDIDMTIWVDPGFLIEASKKVSGFYIKTWAEQEESKKILVFYNDKYMQIASTMNGE
jgi:hypothetical protein